MLPPPRRLFRVLLPVALALGPSGCGGPPAEPGDLRVHDVHVPPGFVPSSEFDPITPPVDRVRQAAAVEGEIVVVPGDARVVSAEGPGAFGLTEENQEAILSDVLALVPDRFDTLVIFTAFEDRAPATRSYYEALQNRVSGIGLQVFDRRTEYGLPADGRLSGYVGMNSPLVWGNGSLDGLDEPQGDFHAAIARELAHRWALYLRFRAPNGMASTALLGANDQDWSSLAQASGSILGGNLLERTAEPPDPMGFADYVNQGRNLGFAPLDLYAMGRIPAEEVPTLFYLTDANLGGRPVERTDDVPVGATVRGRPVIVNVQDVVDALGPRQPSAAAEDPYYRVAFAFVTTPGAARSVWGPQLELLERVRSDLPASWRAWGAGNLCTRITRPCPEPRLVLGTPVIEDDGDGLIGPGETIQLGLAVENTGLGTAEEVEVRLRPTSSAVSVTGGPFIAPPVPQNGTVTLPERFAVTVSSTVACGAAVALEAELRTREGPVFRETIPLPVGTNRLRFDPLEEAPDWRVDPEGTDSASAGAWALGDPEESAVAGVIAQPEDDHTPGDGKLAFVTGPTFGGFFGTNDVDDGRTTLLSPIFALGSADDPNLVLWVWRSVWDFARDPATPLRSAPLVIEVSADGGASWTELGRFEQQTEAWTRVRYRIGDAVEPTDRTRFRFIVEETEVANVEVAIDDLEIVDFLASCEGGPDPMDPMDPVDPGPEDDGDDDGEGGCRGVAPGGPGTLVLLGLALLALARRRRAPGV